jgi:hypothetical protein
MGPLPIRGVPDRVLPGGMLRSAVAPWHTEVLRAEFTAAKIAEAPTFEDYLRLEERFFAELAERVVAPTPTGPAQALVRYSRGSAADPEKQETNWNRSFELPAEGPRRRCSSCTACPTRPTA